MKHIIDCINESKKIGKIPEFSNRNDLIRFFEDTVGVNFAGNSWLYSKVNGRHVYIMFMYEEPFGNGLPDALYINISKNNKAPQKLLFNHSRYVLDDQENWILFRLNGEIRSDFGNETASVKKNFEEFIGKPLKFWSGSESTAIASINDIIRDLQDMGASWTKARA